MSYNRENIKWQSKDGTWNIGFYEVLTGNSMNNDDDYDSEWDVDYDFSTFEWVSVGHATEEDASRAWKGANPGSSNVLEYSRANAKEAREYDEMAKICLDPVYAKKVALKKHREHVASTAAKVKETIIKDKIREGTSVRVIGGSAGPGHKAHNTVLKQDGDWLVGTAANKKTFRVYNTATGKVWHGTREGLRVTINHIERVRDISGYGYVGYYR